MSGRIISVGTGERERILLAGHVILDCIYQSIGRAFPRATMKNVKFASSAFGKANRQLDFRVTPHTASTQIA
jgi:hypothetical protein